MSGGCSGKAFVGSAISCDGHMRALLPFGAAWQLHKIHDVCDVASWQSGAVDSQLTRSAVVRVEPLPGLLYTISRMKRGSACYLVTHQFRLPRIPWSKSFVKT